MGSDGVIGKNPEKIVTVKMALTTDYFEENNAAMKFPFGAQNGVFKQMQAVDNMCEAKKEDCSVNYKQVMKDLF